MAWYGILGHGEPFTDTQTQSSIPEMHQPDRYCIAIIIIIIIIIEINNYMVLAHQFNARYWILDTTYPTPPFMCEEGLQHKRLHKSQSHTNILIWAFAQSALAVESGNPFDLNLGPKRPTDQAQAKASRMYWLWTSKCGPLIWYSGQSFDVYVFVCVISSQRDLWRDIIRLW